MRLFRTACLLFVVLGAATSAFPQRGRQNDQQDKQDKQGKQDEQAKSAKGKQAEPKAQPAARTQGGSDQRSRPSDRAEQQPDQRARPADRAQQQPDQRARPADRAQQPDRRAQPEQRAPQQAQQRQERTSRKQQQRPQEVQRRQETEQRGVWQQRRARSFATEGRTWAQRGGYAGYRIPDSYFRSYYGRSHGFRVVSMPFVVVAGDPYFQYGGYWFSILDPYPEYWGSTWYQTDDVYVDFTSGGYYLYNGRYPNRPGIAIGIAFEQGSQRSTWQPYRARNWESEHRTWRQRGGYTGHRIPDQDFRTNFGRNNGFRVDELPFGVRTGQPGFQYGGYWVSVVDSYPDYWGDDWYDTDDVYVDYSNDGYYLYNSRYPNRAGVAISISF